MTRERISMVLNESIAGLLETVLEEKE